MNESDIAHAIDEDPADQTLQLIYADWLEENGDPRGEAWRVLVEKGIRPIKIVQQFDADGHPIPSPQVGLWVWCWPAYSPLPEVSNSERCLGVRRSFFLMMDDAAIAWVRAHYDPDYRRPER